MLRALRISILLGAAVLALLTSVASAAQTRISIGANVGNGPGNPAALDAWTQTAGAAPSVVMWYQSWAEPLFYPSQMSDVANRGAVPLITWSPALSATTAVPLKDVVAGKRDAYIGQAADDARNWGHPMMIRFAHEMNLTGSPYGPGHDGNTAADFVAAWRHVVQVFRDHGASNVRWVWTPNVDCAGSCPFESFYPGDDYVDWVGLDGYNYSSVSGVAWMSMSEVFARSYDKLRALTGKPMMIAETSSAQAGGDKVAWIRDAFTKDLPVRMPEVRLVVWFNRVKETDWRIDSSQASLASFRTYAMPGAPFVLDPAAPAPAAAPTARPVPAVVPVPSQPAVPVRVMPGPSRSLLIWIACPRGGRCAGSLAVRVRRALVGRASYVVRPSTRRSVRLRGRGVRRLLSGQRPVWVDVSLHERHLTKRWRLLVRHARP